MKWLYLVAFLAVCYLAYNWWINSSYSEYWKDYKNSPFSEQ